VISALSAFKVAEKNCAFYIILLFDSHSLPFFLLLPVLMRLPVIVEDGGLGAALTKDRMVGFHCFVFSHRHQQQHPA
jgi:hypothetical protein